jgi:hypothetical protein
MRFKLTFITLALGLSSLTCTQAPKKAEPPSLHRHPTSEIHRPSRFSLPFKFDLAAIKQLVTHAWSEMTHMTEQLQCVRDICGPESKNFSRTDLTLKQHFHPEVYKTTSPEYLQIDKLLRQILDDEANKFIDLRDSIAFVKNQPEAVSPGILNYFNLLKRPIVAYDSWLSARSEKSPIQSFAWLADPTRQEWIDLGYENDELEFVDELTKAGYFQDLNRIYHRWSWSLNHLAKTDFPNLSLQDAIIKMAQLTIRNYDLFKKNVNLPADYSFDLEADVLIKDPNALIDPNELLSEYLYSSLIPLTINTQFLAISQKYSFNFRAVVDEFYTSEDAKTLDQLVEVPLTEPYQKMLNSCHRTIAQNLFFSGSELRRKSLDTHIKALIQITKKIVDIQDPEQRKEFEKELARLTFTMPLNREKSRQLITRSLQFEVNSDERAKNLEQARVFKAAYFLLGDRSELKTDKNGIPETIFEYAKETCDEWYLSGLSDHIYTASGSVYLSWVTVQHPDIGIGVIAHEIGHAVERILQNMDLASSPHLEHLELRLPYCHATFQTANSQYASEDFADYFAGLLLREQSKTVPWLRNYGCALIHEENDFYKIDLVNNRSGTHSRNPFRILNIENTWRDGDLPKSCETFKARALQCEAPPK